MQNFEKQQQKWSGYIVKRYISTKFGINLFDAGSEKTGFTDDGRPRDDSSSTVQ